MNDDPFAIRRQSAATGVSGEVTITLSLRGEFDLACRDELYETLETAISDAGHGRVILDLQHTVFIDSEALGAILDAYRSAQQAGVRLRLTNAHGIVRRVLDVSGLHFLFDDQLPASRERSVGRHEDHYPG